MKVDLLKQNELLKEELERVREQNASLENEKATLEAENRRLLCEHKQMERRVKELLRRIFGQRSERFIPGQLSLPFVELAGEAAEETTEELPELDITPEDAPPSRRRRKRNGRKPLPATLPRERREIYPDAADLICGCCDEKMQAIGEEITEELEYMPAQFKVIEYARIKFACGDCQEGVTIAPLPPRPIEKGRPGPGLLAHVAVSKYADHLPLYRQEHIFARQDIDLRRSVLCDWLGQLAHLLVPIVMEVKRFILSQILVQSDDTPVRVQNKQMKKMQKGYLWVYCLPWGEVVYDFTLSRSRDGPLEFLSDFQGYLQSDGYAGYNELFRTGRVVHIGCLGHARRRFHEAREESPAETTIALGFIQKLYRIEREAKHLNLNPADKVALRQEKAQPILDMLQEALPVFERRALPKSKLGQAVQYATGQWESLIRYVDVGEADIDNLSAEHCMRNVAIGRKNWLFLGDVKGGGLRSTVLYSLIESCKRLGVEPFAYLRDVVQRVSIHPASRIWELTPRGWKETFGAGAVSTPSSTEDNA